MLTSNQRYFRQIRNDRTCTDADVKRRLLAPLLCPACGGSGVIRTAGVDPNGVPCTDIADCGDCNGTGARP